MKIFETIIVVLAIASAGALAAWTVIKRGKSGGCGGGCTCTKLDKQKKCDK